MENRQLVLGLLLVLSALTIGGCAQALPQSTESPVVVSTDSEAGLPNPASVYCEEQGFTLEIRTDADGGQYGVCVFPDGDECEEWAFFRGECEPGEEAEELVVEQTSMPPAGQAVVGWGGWVISLPDDAQFDDYLDLSPEGAGEVGLAGIDEAVEAQIVDLRDSGQYAHFWGTLNCGVPDYTGCQLIVIRLRPDGPGPFFAPDLVEGWEGMLYGNAPGSQVDDYFVVAGDFPMHYGIASALSINNERELEPMLESLRDTGTSFRVWGEVTCGIPDANGCQILVTRIEINGETYSLTPMP